MGKTEAMPYSLGRLGKVEKYCRMITRDGDSLLDNAVEDLAVRARVGEVVRWRGVSLTADEECEVSILEVSASVEGMFEKPRAVPGKKDLWEAEVLTAGTGKFRFRFLVEEKTGKRRKGYFVWNPGMAVPEDGNLEEGMDGSGESEAPAGDVEILCVVDGQSLLEKYGARPETVRLTHATGIGKYCRMVTRDRDQSRMTNASPDLVVRARNGAHIHWRAVSLTDDKEYRVDVTGFYSIDSSVATTPERSGARDLWTSEIVGESGRRTNYYLKFKVVAEDGKTEGDFDWDPGIEVI